MNRSGRRSLTVLLLGAWIAALGCGSVQAFPRELLQAVPRDVVAAYFVDGSPSTASPNAGPSLLQWGPLVADQVQRLGLLSRASARTRLWIDVLTTAAVALRYPHAVVLLDIRARPRADGGHELAGAKAALILLTRGANDRTAAYRQIERRIQHLLNTYTNRDETVLEERRPDDHGATRRSFSAGCGSIFTIRDRRLPAWLTLTWGRMSGAKPPGVDQPLSDYYVVAMGEGVFDRIEATLAEGQPTGGRVDSLADDRWFAESLWPVDPKGSMVSRDEVGPREVPTPVSFAAYVRFARLADRLDPGLVRKVREVKAALGLADAERALWSYRRVGRAVEINCRYKRNGRTRVRPIAGGQADPDFLATVLPEQAGGYAVIDADPSTLLRGACQAYLSSRGPEASEKKRAFWRAFEADAGVSVERDIFSHLRGPFVVHSYPPHPLRLPLAWSIVVPVEGDADVLRRNVDRWLEEARLRLVRVDGADHNTQWHPPSTKWHPPHPDTADGLQLHRDADGVWFTQFGLVGPALVVADNQTAGSGGWLVVSFSPYAVRQNVAMLTK